MSEVPVSDHQCQFLCSAQLPTAGGPYTKNNQMEHFFIFCIEFWHDVNQDSLPWLYFLDYFEVRETALFLRSPSYTQKGIVPRYL